MASFEWQAYKGSTPEWEAIDTANRKFVVSGSLTDLTVTVDIGAWQDGTHLGSGVPGSDQCGSNHMNNVKYLTGSTMSVNGGGSESIDDTNLTDDECTLKIVFSHASAVIVTVPRLYCFDGNNPLVRATGVDMKAFERGVGATSWTTINNDTAEEGGDNIGERLDLAEGSHATEHSWYVAVSVSPAVPGSVFFTLGMALTYS